MVLSESTVWQNWWVYLQGLLDCGQERLGQFTGHSRVHSQDQGLYAHYLIHEWAWPLLGPLVYGAGDTTKAKQGCSWVFRGMELFPCLYLGPRSASQLPGCRAAFSEWLSLVLDCTEDSQPPIWIPKPQQMHFYLLIDVDNYRFWWGDMSEGHLIWPSCWGHFALFFNFIQQTHNKDLSGTANLIGPEDIKINVSIPPEMCFSALSCKTMDYFRQEL